MARSSCSAVKQAKDSSASTGVKNLEDDLPLIKLSSPQSFVDILGTYLYQKRLKEMQRRNIKGGGRYHSSVVRNVSQTNRRARSLSLLTIGGQWVCGWSADSPGQKMPRLPGRGDTYGDETIFCSQNPRKCGSNIPQCLPQTCFPKQLQN